MRYSGRASCVSTIRHIQQYESYICKSTDSERNIHIDNAKKYNFK